jgi:hypothetical protein
MEETSSSEILLIPLRFQHGFDEDQLDFGMCEEAWGVECKKDISSLLEQNRNEYPRAQI